MSEFKINTIEESELKLLNSQDNEIANKLIGVKNINRTSKASANIINSIYDIYDLQLDLKEKLNYTGKKDILNNFVMQDAFKIDNGYIFIVDNDDINTIGASLSISTGGNNVSVSNGTLDGTRAVITYNTSYSESAGNYAFLNIPTNIEQIRDRPTRLKYDSVSIRLKQTTLDTGGDAISSLTQNFNLSVGLYKSVTTGNMTSLNELVKKETGVMQVDDSNRDVWLHVRFSKDSNTGNFDISQIRFWLNSGNEDNTIKFEIKELVFYETNNFLIEGGDIFVNGKAIKLTDSTLLTHRADWYGSSPPTNTSDSALLTTMPTVQESSLKTNTTAYIDGNANPKRIKTHATTRQNLYMDFSIDRKATIGYDIRLFFSNNAGVGEGGNTSGPYIRKDSTTNNLFESFVDNNDNFINKLRISDFLVPTNLTNRQIQDITTPTLNTIPLTIPKIFFIRSSTISSNSVELNKFRNINIIPSVADTTNTLVNLGKRTTTATEGRTFESNDLKILILEEGLHKVNLPVIFKNTFILGNEKSIIECSSTGVLYFQGTNLHIEFGLINRIANGCLNVDSTTSSSLGTISNLNDSSIKIYNPNDKYYFDADYDPDGQIFI